MILDALRRTEKPDSSLENFNADASVSGNTQGFNSLLFIAGLIAGVILAPLFWGLGSNNEINQKHHKIRTVYDEGSIKTPLVDDLSTDKPIDPRSPNLKSYTILDSENEASSQATASYPLSNSDRIKPNKKAKDLSISDESKRAKIVALNRAMWRDANEKLLRADDLTESQNDRAGPDLQSSRTEETIPESKSGTSIKMEKASPSINFADAIQKAAVELGRGALEPHPAVLLENLSQQFKNELPTISYDSHDFIADLGPSVTLNGVLLREGEKLGLLEVRDILRDSVILRFNETDFRLKALNTWLNL